MTIAALVAPLCLLLSAPIGGETETEWTNTDGGAYGDPSNWSNGVPVDGDVGILDLGPFPIPIDLAPGDYGRLVVRSGIVEAIVGTNAAVMRGDDSNNATIEIGTTSGQAARIGVNTSSGFLGALIGNRIDVASAAGGFGHISAGSSSQIIANDVLRIGVRGTGTGIATAGGVLMGDTIELGVEPGSAGFLDVDLIPLIPSFRPQRLLVGHRGLGAFTAGGGLMTCQSLIVGEESSAVGFVEVENATVTGTVLKIGDAGFGEMSIQSGSEVTFDHTSVGVLGSGDGLFGNGWLIVDDATFVANATVQIGTGGHGTLALAGGGRMLGAGVLEQGVHGRIQIELDENAYTDAPAIDVPAAGPLSIDIGKALLYQPGFTASHQILIADESQEVTFDFPTPFIGAWAAKRTGDVISVIFINPDLNNDNDVDIDDLLALFANWSSSCSPCVGDLNQDQAVDIEDLLLMLSLMP